MKLFKFQKPKKPQIDELDIAALQIKKHEGLRLKMYKDTVGVSTIGYGHNLEANGISLAVAEQIFEEDLIVAAMIARDFAGDAWVNLNEVRRAVLINMAFNLGNRLKFFVNTREALLNHDYDLVAERMSKSKWYTQIGNRGKELVMQMQNGVVHNG